MFDVLIYAIIVYVVLFIMFLSNYDTIKKKQVIDFKDYNEKPNKKIRLFIIVLISFILSLYSANLAISGSLSDTVRYAWSFTYRYPSRYESIETLFNSETEFGFLLLIKLIKYFTSNTFLIFFIIAFITTFINIYVAFKISKKHVFIVFLYLVSIYFFQSTYLIRQTLAVSIGNLALLFLFKGFNIRYLLLSFLALAFHSTAIILIPMFFIFKLIKSDKGYFLIILISIFIFLGFSSTMNAVIESIPYLEQHLNHEILLENNQGSFSTILKGIPFYYLTLLALLKRAKIVKLINHANIYIISSMLYSLSFIFSHNMYWFFRMGWYFLMPTLALVPIVFNTYKNKNEKIIYLSFFILSLLIITGRQIYITLN